jgi:hypothetical protein
MTETPDKIKSEKKVAIGIAYVNASNGSTANRVDWTGTLIAMVGGAAQIREDRKGMALVQEARKQYRGALEAMKQEHTSLDAVDICMGILISLDPLIFDSERPYGKLDLKTFSPVSTPTGDK